MAPTVLITGASQGTGKATALLFAQKGYQVVLAARQADRLQAVAKTIAATGQPALAIPTDLTQADQVNQLVQTALDRFSSIDVLVNNAGICLTGPLLQTTSADWQQLMGVNFWGYLYTIQALLPSLIAQAHSGSRPCIVNVGSFGGKMPLPYMTAYCASKYAVTGLTDSLRLELKDQGIHVGAVHPGVINSDFLERAQFRGADAHTTAQYQQRLETALKSGWVSQPQDIAQAIWQVVDQRRAEVVVGPIALATEAYRLLPGLVQWALGQTV